MTLQIVDAHMHFWSVTDNDWYAALKPFAEQVGSDTLFADFLPDDYTAAAPEVDVQSFVHVSATTTPRMYLDETRWVNQLADDHGLSLGIVGSIDPTLPANEMLADLDAQASSATRRFRGVRVFPGLDPDLPAATVLLDWLETHDFLFDLVAQPDAMANWTEKLTQRPDLRTVVEHTGWPSAVDEAGFDHWRTAIGELATRTDALCKVTGLGMATMELSESTLRPWVEGAIDAFGWDRVAFGSNMPIETIAGSYRQLIDSMEAILGHCSDSERERFYLSNARRSYRL